MTDREKVIKGLECLTRATEFNAKLKSECSECAYKGTDCELTVMKDALKVIQAQEPRVMKLEEVDEGKPYWLEMRGAVSEYAICNLNDHGDSAFLDFATQLGYKTLETDGYGKCWRCWTARPTDEQREAVSWDD